jgi:2-keto-3-deoxy-L-rhamnonate aldolase RhmA|tara:strand:+ start:82 stop:966 length:885 start_codon:yes stop_codon:yes gene_type:complete
MKFSKLTFRPAMTALLLFMGSLLSTSFAQQSEVRIFNTVKTKLAAGQQVIGGTVSTPDPDIYCAMANSGYDYIWIEMQHSHLGYTDVARMIWACKDAPAIPFIRVPDATEGDIQKAVDIGALGIIVPMVDTAGKMERAVRFAKYPPIGRRSQGGGQYGAIWGRDYRAAANDNIMIIAMIETEEGTAAADEIAQVDGVDLVFVASSDLSSFSGRRQGDPVYENLVTRIKTETTNAGKYVGGPSAWMNTRDGYQFFQGPGTSALIRAGVRVTLEESDPCRFLPSGTAPVQGEDPCP